MQRSPVYPKCLYGAKQAGVQLAGFSGIIPLGQPHNLIPNTKYTFTLEATGWLPSDSAFESALKNAFYNKAVIDSVNRGLFSGRYVVTMTPVVEGLGINGAAAQLVIQMRNLGNESKVVEVNEDSSVSTQPGGVLQVAAEAPKAVGKVIYKVAETVSSGVGAASQGVATGLIKSAWPLLLGVALLGGAYFIGKDIIVKKLTK